MWWSMYSIFGSECGGSLLIPAFSGTEISIKRRGMMPPPLFRRLHQLRWISADATGIAWLCVRQTEIVVHRLQAGDWRGRIVLRIDHQRTRYAKHGIRIDMLVVAEVQRGDQFAIAVAADQEVDVRGTEAVAVLRLHHVADRSIHRDGITQRPHR